MFRRDPLARALDRIEDATAAFQKTAESLGSAADTLKALAAQADHQATVAALRAGTARAQAARAQRRADNIRELLA
jgi:hypothetical protein